MSLRRLPPVHSPLSAAALLTGVRTAVSGAASGHARGDVLRWIGDTYSPAAALLTDSGTTALSLAMRLALPSGGRVALPAWGCFDLATACDGAGVDVLLYDLDPGTLAPDGATLRAAFEAGARAVVVVHYYGLPVAMTEVNALAREYGAIVIEDAAQGAGATLGGKACGASGGGLTVLSFGRGKGITAGRGGALLGLDPRFATPIGALAAGLHHAAAGWGELPTSLAQHLLARPSLYGIPAALPFLKLGETLYHPPHPAAPLPRASGGILSVTLGLAGAETAWRCANAARLLEAVSRNPRLCPVAPAAGAVPGYLRLPVLGAAMGPRLARDPSARALGIMPGYPGTLAELAGFASRVRNTSVRFAGARELASKLGTVPTHGWLGAADLERLEAWLLAAVAT